MKRILQAIILLFVANSAFAQAFRTPTFTGNAFTDFTTNERVFFGGGGNYNLTWDATNLYVGVGGLGTYIKNEPTIMYLDTDPAVSPSGGTGSLSGNNYDGRIGTLPFTSNLVLYLKNGYAEVRTTTAANWTVNTYNNVTSNIVTGTNDIEITIPWTMFPGGVRPLAFRSLFFKENGGGGTDAYNIMPGDAYNSNINDGANIVNGSFLTWNTNTGVMPNTLTAICAPPVLTLTSDVTVDFNEYRGTGFTTTPLANIGQLCTNTWAVTGWSDGNKPFGGSTSIATTGDHARGLRAAAVTTGGFYGINRGGTDYAFLIQPAGTPDFAPGTLTLKVQNTTGSTLNAYQVMYDVLEFNDQNRSSSFNFSYSTDDVTYTPVTALNYTTVQAASASPAFVVTPQNTIVNGISVPNNGFFYLRWSSADVGGTGSRDEFGLDNIIIKKTASFPYCLPTGAACGGNFVRETKLLNGTTPILTNTTNACNNNGYTFFSALAKPDLSRASSYNFDITASAPGDFGNYSIWIDYNQDGDFDDAGELVGSNTANGATATSTGSFVIPVTALAGNTRMRVAYTNINAGTVILTPCNTGQIGEYEDYTVNIVACALPLVAKCKDVTVTMNTASVTVPAANLDNISTGCVPLTFSTVNNTFTCADIGTKTLTLTVKDVNNATATCSSTVTIKDGTACNGTASIKDPCICKAASTNLKNGQFDDKVEITASLGQTWRIQSVSGFFKPTSAAPPAAPIPYAVGDLIPSVGGGKYELEGIHVDSIGYSLVAERVDAAMTVLQTLNIANKCYYPTPRLTAPAAMTVPLSDCPITLAADEKNGGTGTATFKINGAAATTFNALTLGQGTHTIEITFDAGTYNATTGINPALSKPACIEKLTKTITVGPPIVVTLACADNLTFSLDPALCKLTLTPNQLIQNGVNCEADYTVTVMNGTNPIAQPLTAANLNTVYSYKVKALDGNSCWGTFKIEDKVAPVFTNCPLAPINKFCEDDLLINVSNSNQLASNAVLTASGATGAAISIFDCNPYTTTYSDIVVKNACGNPIATVINRTIKATDNFGNTATCPVIINVNARTLADVTVNPSVTVTCADISGGTIAPSASNSPYITATGKSINAANCDFTTTYTDVVSPTCGNSIAITRNWVVIDCAGSVKNFMQVIMAKDNTLPVFTNCDATDLVIGVNGNNCDVDNFTPKLPTATDNCDNAPKVTVKIVNASNIQVAAGNTMSDIPAGLYKIVYTATDACGNAAVCSRNLIVEDKTAPVAVCDLNTKVALSSDGTAILAAETVNDGSLDNCCLDVNSFEIKRMSESDALFRKNITITCADTAFMVVMRVRDCNKNANMCMVNVRVEDKLPPVAFGRDTVVCCSNTPLASAWLDANPIKLKSLIDYPTASNPGYYDNCSATAKPTVSGAIDNCGNGKVTHTWAVKDPSGLTATTTVNYISEGRSAYTVTFPDDVTLTCNNNKVYATDVKTTGQPAIANLGQTCALVGVEYKDEIFKVVPDACFKIIRTWKVLNWCQPQNGTLNPNKGDIRKIGSSCATQARTYTNIDEKRPDGTSVYATSAPCNGMMTAIKNEESCYNYDTDGYMEYQQVIKVIDLTPPTIVAGKVTLEPVAKECKVEMTITAPTSTDCTGATADSYEIVRTSNNVILASGTITTPSFKKTFTEAEFGDYVVRFKTTDQCGNFNSTDVKVTVKDIKKPTPVCHNWLSVELMANKMVMIDAKLIDAGSYDNCTVPSKLKFKIQVPAPNPKVIDINTINPDTIKTFFTFTCPPVGTVPDPANPNAYFITVALWVGDEAGNWDYCQTVVNVQDNMDICGYAPIQMKPMAGEVMTETQKEVENVTISLDGMKKGQSFTSAQGKFNFADLPVVGNYTVTPEKDVNPLNGVSTLDLVLISKHILAVQPLTSPYKMIAADVNRNGTITTADIVELRKMILAIQTNFTKNASWRFVDKDFVFPDVTNPWLTTFAETKSFTGLNTSANANFVAVKVGDVSGNANPTGQAAGRNDKGTFLLNTDEQALRSGETVKVTMSSAQMASFLAYQMTLAYNPSMVELVDIQGDAQNFGTPEAGFVTYSQADNKDASYTLIFRAKTNGMLSQALSINSRYTNAEAYNLQGETYNIVLNFKGKQNENLALYQNRPNPFDGTTTISFNMPTQENARIVISDVSGKIIKTIEAEYAKGYNEINVSKAEIGTSGVLYYRLETATETLTKKMIVIE
jgi:GEVED domain/Secretion system C-terminal sorting domain/Dockerin type I domain